MVASSSSSRHLSLLSRQVVASITLPLRLRSGMLVSEAVDEAEGRRVGVGFVVMVLVLRGGLPVAVWCGAGAGVVEVKACITCWLGVGWMRQHQGRAGGATASPDNKQWRPPPARN